MTPFFVFVLNLHKLDYPHWSNFTEIPVYSHNIANVVISTIVVVGDFSNISPNKVDLVLSEQCRSTASLHFGYNGRKSSSRGYSIQMTVDVVRIYDPHRASIARITRSVDFYVHITPNDHNRVFVGSI